MPHRQSNTPQHSSTNEERNNQPGESAPENEELEYDSFSDNIDLNISQNTPPPASEQSEDQVRVTFLEEELARTKDIMIRAVAEAENGRKRALKERENASKFAISGFSKDLLSVADNLRRALDSVPPELLEQVPQIKNLTDGIEATERELLRSFTKHGIQKIEPLGEQFDPNFHEVMFETPMPDKEAGTIIQIIESGYTLHGRILRPARVGVVKNDSGGAQPPPSQEPGQTIDTQA